MQQAIFLWNRAPFVRLILPLSFGIVVQWHLAAPLFFLLITVIISLGFMLTFSFLPLKLKYAVSPVNGMVINLVLAATGSILVSQHDIRNKPHWIGTMKNSGSLLEVVIEEPLVKKPNSYKTIASIICSYDKSAIHPAEGKIIIYFVKDPAVLNLHYGSVILLKKPLEEIRNPGNPGSFDYKRYNLFLGITHQAFLSAKDFETLPLEIKSNFTQFIFDCRNSIIKTLKKFVTGQKEQGLAGALLIGYRDELDKDLVQSYTNTGVVHIIAISGMHLALIYGLLVLITKSLKQKKKFHLLRLVIILSGLWLFSFLAGAQPSVVRSTLMFTCLALGELAERKTSAYNSLALSAFLLLCYNPFWLWDVGFQLSYAAVLSIVVFYRPVCNWFYLPNKLLDAIWKTISISIAAQVLTTPVSLYHFHQFPVLFLLTNLVAVPLSSLVLFAEIILCCFAWLMPLARLTGWLTGTLIYWMNSYIERLEKISFALWSGFSLSLLQTLLLLAITGSISYWLMEKKKSGFFLSIGIMFLFISLRSYSFLEAAAQKRIIIYNVSRFRAIDLIAGRSYNFLGDTQLAHEGSVKKFYLEPSRILQRLKHEDAIPFNTKAFKFLGKRILIIDSAINIASGNGKWKIDILILSRNPKLQIAKLIKCFDIGCVVIDSSVPAWKAALWKKECETVCLSCFDVKEKGAFVMNL